MADLLTVKFVERLKPDKVRREVPDAHIPGLYLVVQPSGAKSWAIRYRSKGKPTKLTLGSWPQVDLATARTMARDSLAKVASGSNPAADKAEERRKAQDHDGTVEAVSKVFIKRHAKANNRARWAAEVERLLEKDVWPAIGRKRMEDVKRTDLAKLLSNIVERGAPILANRVRAVVRKFFAWSVSEGLLETSPATGLKAPSKERARDRVLSDDELACLWRATLAEQWPMQQFLQVLILTGQRRTEVADMRWKEIDLKSKVWSIPADRSKNGRAHVVPLSDDVVRILEAMPRIDRSPLVFTTTGETPISGFSRLAKRIGQAMAADWKAAGNDEPIAPWVLHDLRRTFATGAARMGIRLEVVEKVLNHISGSFGGVAGVYQRHEFETEKRHALDAWASHVKALTERQPDNVVKLHA